MTSILTRILLLLLAGIFIVVARKANKHQTASQQAVNIQAGTARYVTRFEELPTLATPDFLRVQTHLAYAEQQLHQRAPVGLSAARRARLLNMHSELLNRWVAASSLGAPEYALIQPAYAGPQQTLTYGYATSSPQLFGTWSWLPRTGWQPGFSPVSLWQQPDGLSLFMEHRL